MAIEYHAVCDGCKQHLAIFGLNEQEAVLSMSSGSLDARFAARFLSQHRDCWVRLVHQDYELASLGEQGYEDLGLWTDHEKLQVIRNRSEWGLSWDEIRTESGN